MKKTHSVGPVPSVTVPVSPGNESVMMGGSGTTVGSTGAGAVGSTGSCAYAVAARTARAASLVKCIVKWAR